ncbi:MAG: hypothetical protein CW346_10465 [Bacillaceae bacterium]|nr:hypothetical protein [Bacillaceae bacterium]
MKKCCLKGRRSHIGEILPGSIFSVGERDRDYFKRKTSGRFRFPASLSRLNGRRKTARGGPSPWEKACSRGSPRSWSNGHGIKHGRGNRDGSPAPERFPAWIDDQRTSDRHRTAGGPPSWLRLRISPSIHVY